MCKSTTVLELFVQSKAIISIEKLMGSRLDDHMDLPDNRLPFLKDVWQPSSLSELIELVEKSISGTITPTNGSDEIKKYLKDYFNYPRDVSAKKLIADEMSKYITTTTSSTSSRLVKKVRHLYALFVFTAIYRKGKKIKNNFFGEWFLKDEKTINPLR